MHNHLGSQPWALGHVMGESNLGSSRGDLAVQSLCGEQQAPSPEAPWAPHSSQPALETLPCKVYLMPAARHGQPIRALERKKVSMTRMGGWSGPYTLLPQV